MKLQYFRDHLDSWCADDYFERRQAPGRIRRAWLALQLAWLYLAMPLICAIRGHQLVDDDPGDPEVGPQPRVYCERCGDEADGGARLRRALDQIRLKRARQMQSAVREFKARISARRRPR